MFMRVSEAPLAPKCQSRELSWTHFVELLKIDNPLERSFYTLQTVIEKWSTTQLIRQKKSSLFLRLAASKDKEGTHGSNSSQPG